VVLSERHRDDALPSLHRAEAVAAASLAVVIPAYRVRNKILPLLAKIGPEVSHIFVVDDACPEQSGAHVAAECHDSRVIVLVHERNQGVGGAVMTGYQHAVAAGADVLVKLDGDGQMDPALIPQLVAPILDGRADYTKGNRFYNVEDVRAMPIVRLLGNAALSFMTKLSSGYWNVFDPTNGFTAISRPVASHLPLNKIARRYFFESDMLFRLGTLQALIVDVPMTAAYADETSSLVIRRILLPFLWGNLTNFFKRVFYSYFLRGFSIASVELVAGTLLLLFGAIFGLWQWTISLASGRPAATGIIMIAALPVILGVQLLLSFLAFDIATSPSRPITALLPPRRIAAEPLAPLASQMRCGVSAMR
jgi:glycosyltransferase involved in cell wall biosynthesis